MIKNKLRKRIDIEQFTNNWNKNNNDYYLSNYAVSREPDGKIILMVPVPIDGDENNLELYDLAILDMEDLVKSYNFVLSYKGRQE